MEVFQIVLAVIAAFGIPSAITQFTIRRFENRLALRDAETRKIEAKKAAEETKREEAREQSTLLLIQCVGASVALGEATARAVRDRTCNGEMKAALEYATKVKHEQKDFMARQAVKNLHD